MADEQSKEVDSAISGLSKPDSGGKKKLLLMAAMSAVVVIGSAASAVVVGKILSKGPEVAAASEKKPAAAEAGDGKEGADAKDASKEHADAKTYNEHLAYYDFEPIIVNLSTERLERYVRVTMVLAFKSEDEDAAKKQVDKQKPELKNWLTLYLSGCTLADVRGPKNLNRIRREIEESFNDLLWKDGRPLIDHVLFKEFAIQ